MSCLTASMPTGSATGRCPVAAAQGGLRPAPVRPCVRPSQGGLLAQPRGGVLGLRRRIITNYREAAAPSTGKYADEAEEALAKALDPLNSGYGTTLPEMLDWAVANRGNELALIDRHHKPRVQMTYRELYAETRQFAAGMAALGLAPGSRVALFSENSARWVIADHAVMVAGCADVVRGAQAPEEELQWILGHSDASAIIVQDPKVLKGLLDGPKDVDWSKIGFVVVLWKDDAVTPDMRARVPCPVVSYDEAIAAGADAPAVDVAVKPSDLATIVYTSGTSMTGARVTGGAALTHANLMYQVNTLGEVASSIQSEEGTINLLPPWHIYERSALYHCIVRGTTQIFTNKTHLKSDLARHRPAYFCVVPMVCDALQRQVLATLRKGPAFTRAVIMSLLAVSTAYIRARRIMEGTALKYACQSPSATTAALATATALLLAPLHRLADRLVYSKMRGVLGVKLLVSGGSSLPQSVDDFFEIIGIPLINGWGLTETSPVVACRASAPGNPGNNVRGTVGRVLTGSQVRVVDPATHADLPDGEQGLLLVKGPGVMIGYWGDDAATEASMSDGWYNTGDLGWRCPEGVAGSKMGGCIVITGRAKDTIVMANGENVEPQPIEDACAASPLVGSMLVVGQDCRALGVMVNADMDGVQLLCESQGKAFPPPEAELKEMILAELQGLNAERVGYQAHHALASIQLLPAPFSIDDDTLTRTMKPKRNTINTKYAKQLSDLYDALGQAGNRGNRGQ